MNLTTLCRDLLTRCPLVMFAVTVSAASILAAGCTATEFEAPPISTLDKAPMLVDPIELYNEYMTNPDDTLARYQGEKLYFPEVRVDALSFLGEPPDKDLFVQMQNVKFRVAYASQLLSVREGYTVEVVGELWGMQWSYLIIKNCWIRLIDPPGGNPNLPPEY